MGAWQVRLAENPDAFTVQSVEPQIVRSLEAQATAAPGEFHLVLEVVYAISGKRPHALVVASFSPEPTSTLRLEVVAGGPFSLDGVPVLAPSGLPMVRAFPTEFAEAVAVGFTRPRPAAPPSGSLFIGGGAIDHDSSPWVFERCGRVLRGLLPHLGTPGFSADLVTKTVRELELSRR